MNRFTRACCAFLLMMALSAPIASASEINVESAAVSFQTVDGERIATFLHFVASSAEFTLRSPSGRYNEATEVMTAIAQGDERAVLTKSGESSFEVSAATEIGISFDDETLAALGDVTFLSDELDARSDELFVDRLSSLKARIDALKSSITLLDTLELIESFLANVGADDRLILLSGNVRVVREDTTMESAWMLVNEADQSEFISIADPDRKLTLTIVTQEETSEDESQD